MVFEVAYTGQVESAAFYIIIEALAQGAFIDQWRAAFLAGNGSGRKWLVWRWSASFGNGSSAAGKELCANFAECFCVVQGGINGFGQSIQQGNGFIEPDNPDADKVLVAAH